MVETPQQRQFLRRAFVKKIARRLIALIALASLIYAIAAVVYATKTIYKVKRNYAVVLERFGGNRETVTAVGWHVRLPFFTRIEQEVALMNQHLFLGGQEEPMRIISKGNVALWTSAVLTYRIHDLHLGDRKPRPHESAAGRLRRHRQGSAPGPAGGRTDIRPRAMSKRRSSRP
jgi:hypothetical protein